MEEVKTSYVDAAASEITSEDAPNITRDEPGRITLTWPKYELIVDATRFTNKGQAELMVWWDNADHQVLLAQDKVDLLSSSGKQALIRQLKHANGALEYAPWDWIIRCVTYKVLDSSRRGDPPKEVWPVEGSTLEAEYLVEPILYENHPTVIFGDYATLKSTVALAIAYVTQLPYKGNGLGLIPRKDHSTPTLYLDLEGDEITFTKRWSALSKGFPVAPQMPILYRRMDGKVADSIDTIQEIVNENKIKFVIIDSLGPAVRGNLNDSEPAIEYNQALRKLGITSLTLAHNAKDPLTKQRSIFGSVYFSNLARSIWQCKIEGERDPGDNQAIISLKQEKASFSKPYGILGYQFTFSDSAIKIARVGLEDTKLSGELPLSWQVKHLLKDGALQATKIAEMLDRDVNSIRVTLTRMAKNQQVINLSDHSWELPTKG
jgi:hypothetical protein